ncbi:MAG: hypothetical protein WBM44_20380 [Waterburya sp.]
MNTNNKSAPKTNDPPPSSSAPNKQTRQQTLKEKAKALTDYARIALFLQEKKVVAVAGEKGANCAKSFSADKLIDFVRMLESQEHFTLGGVYDTDLSNPTTALYYGSELEVRRSIFFTEDKENNSTSDELIEQIVINLVSPLLLDTPSQFFRSFYHSYTEGGLKDTALEYGISFLFFYVCPPDREIVHQFLNILTKLETTPIYWVLVKNLFRSTKAEWEELLKEKAICSTLKKYQVVEMYLPELKRPEITMIERQKLCLSKAIAECPTLVGKTRLLRYQRECHAEFTRVFLELMKLHEQ